MSNLSRAPEAEACAAEPSAAPAIEALPGIATGLGDLAITRLLPRSRRRLVGPWCFCDAFGPIVFGSGKAMDVPPHPHIGLQTVSWLLEGEVLHHDSLGREGLGQRGVLNLMTAGRGIAHAEETPADSSGRLRGVQLWVALPEAHRETEPSFEQLADLPALDLDGGQAVVFAGTLGTARAGGRSFWPATGAELRVDTGGRLSVPLDPGFEHALIPLDGGVTIDGTTLQPGTLYYLGSRRRDLVLSGAAAPAHLILLGGAPFEDSILMWWNFVARTPDEMASARDDWEAGRRFGDVTGYAGPRLAAPPLSPRPAPVPPR